MRVTSYFVTFVAVAFTSLLVGFSYLSPNVLATRINVLHRTSYRRRDQTGAASNVDLYPEAADAYKDRLVVKYKEVLYTTVTVFYGLTQRCQLQITQTDDGKLSYRNYECRKFPTPETEYCDKDEYKYICAIWTSAYYLDQIALGIGAVVLVAVLFGVTTQSRRRRIWKTVAGLLFLTAFCQVSVFVLVTDLYNKSAFPSFDRSRPGLGYILHTLSWVLNVIIVLAVIGTGISSDSGHQWAAGNDAYAPIA